MLKLSTNLLLLISLCSIPKSLGHEALVQETSDVDLVTSNSLERKEPQPLQHQVGESLSSSVVQDVRVECGSERILVSVKTHLDSFNGMIYPKGLAKNSSCKAVFVHAESEVNYTMPLHACNTMSTDVDGGVVEYFNTIVVQPHRKLVTNQGQGYHIRCRYRTQTRKPDANGEAERSEQLASMPGSWMRVYRGDPIAGRVAENVAIGDELTLVIGIDDQDIYGMVVNQCFVQDGIGWTEQQLIDQRGCPVDKSIMSELSYSAGKKTALVRFAAHRFPHASSVYYRCSVRLCVNHAGGCDHAPPVCDAEADNSNFNRRVKRQTIELDQSNGLLYDEERDNLQVKVYSGLFVNEASDLDDEYFDQQIDDDVARVRDPTRICFPQRDFAIAMAIIGLILMLVVIVALLCLISRRRRRKDLSTTGSSIYSSGPYSNSSS